MKYWRHLWHELRGTNSLLKRTSHAIGHDDQDPSPPPPDSDLSKRRRHDTSASRSSQPPAPQSSAWKKSDTRDAPSSSSKQQSGPYDDQPVEDIPIPDFANKSDSGDSGSAHLPHVKPRPEWLKPIPEDDRPATPEPACVIPTSHIPDAENNWANALATTYQDPAEKSLLEKTRDMRTFMNWYCQKMGKIDWTNPEGDQVRIDINRPLPLSSPPGHVTVQTQFFYNHDLDYLRYGSHLNHLPGSDIRMLSTAVKLWTRNLVIRQRVEDFQLGIESYQKQLNLTKPGWDATGFEFKHDYIIIDSPRAIVFPVSNNKRKIMRFNEIYKFSDGTLINIMEALDYRVKEYKVNRLNPDVPIKRTGKLGDSDVHTLEDPTLILEIMSRRFFLRLNLPDQRSVLTGSGGSSKDGDGDTLFQWRTSRTTNNQAFTIKKGMSMPVQMSPAQDGKRPKVDDQRLDLADDLKEAQDHISSTITSHKTKITTSMYKISHEESKTTS
ncbi:hypothetical protein Tco_0472139 [Tanacetum coccineum]